jgi:hypothetical protein
MGSKTNSVNVNIRDKIELKKVYQARNNSVKDEKGDLVTDSSVLRIGKRITCQQLNTYIGLIMLGMLKYIHQNL